MTHLRQVTTAEIDSDTLAKIRASAAGNNFTVLEGMVTRRIFILVHKAATPSKELVDQYEREEFAALKPIGARQ
ncbi:MAG TPA: hypothetical protein VME42_11450 [Steroidobacteraceae bacterium]|nr:hypothetical protein [Steroidobacteraceae bacterium]